MSFSSSQPYQSSLISVNSTSSILPLPDSVVGPAGIAQFPHRHPVFVAAWYKKNPPSKTDTISACQAPMPTNDTPMPRANQRIGCQLLSKVYLIDLSIYQKSNFKLNAIIIDHSSNVSDFYHTSVILFLPNSTSPSASIFFSNRDITSRAVPNSCAS